MQPFRAALGRGLRAVLPGRQRRLGTAVKVFGIAKDKTKAAVPPVVSRRKMNKANAAILSLEPHKIASQERFTAAAKIRKGPSSEGKPLWVDHAAKLNGGSGMATPKRGRCRGPAQLPNPPVALGAPTASAEAAPKPVMRITAYDAFAKEARKNPEIQKLSSSEDRKFLIGQLWKKLPRQRKDQWLEFSSKLNQAKPVSASSRPPPAPLSDGVKSTGGAVDILKGGFAATLPFGPPACPTKANIPDATNAAFTGVAKSKSSLSAEKEVSSVGEDRVAHKKAIKNDHLREGTAAVGSTSPTQADAGSPDKTTRGRRSRRSRRPLWSRPSCPLLLPQSGSLSPRLYPWVAPVPFALVPLCSSTSQGIPVRAAAAANTSAPGSMLPPSHAGTQVAALEAKVAQLSAEIAALQERLKGSLDCVISPLTEREKPAAFPLFMMQSNSRADVQALPVEDRLRKIVQLWKEEQDKDKVTFPDAEQRGASSRAKERPELVPPVQASGAATGDTSPLLPPPLRSVGVSKPSRSLEPPKLAHASSPPIPPPVSEAEALAAAGPSPRCGRHFLSSLRLRAVPKLPR
eukprot:RCo046629